MSGWQITLPHRLFNLRYPIRPLEHLARLGSVGGAHDAVPLHQVDQVRRAPVANAQPPLQQGSGSLPELENRIELTLLSRPSADQSSVGKFGVGNSVIEPRNFNASPKLLRRRDLQIAGQTAYG